jgi:hypothetical protein
MEKIHVWFTFRLRSKESLALISERASRVLNCTFVPRRHQDRPDVRVADAEAMCLRLHISQWAYFGDPALWIYQLKGENVVEPRWDYSTELNLTDWLLQEFQRRDSPEWYVPTMGELRKEAGID